jgi:uncharacterized protein
VIDLLELERHIRASFVRDFLDSLVSIPKELYRPILVVIDEAHGLCPEGTDSVATRAVIRLMDLGRKRGLCGILATQRLSKLDKDAAAECGNILIGRTSAIDIKRGADLLGIPQAQRFELTRLGDGELLCAGPALTGQSREDGVYHFKIGETFTTRPKPGEQHKASMPAASSAIRKVLPELADLARREGAEPLTLDEAKAVIADLRRRQPQKAIEIKEKRVEVPVLKNGQLSRTEKILDRTEALAEQLKTKAAELQNESLQLRTMIKPATSPSPAIAPPRPMPARMPARAASTVSKPATIVSGPADGVTGVEQRILDGLAELELLGVEQPDRVQVAFLAGYSNLNSKGFTNALGGLRSAGRIDYPGAGTVALTESGRETARTAGQPRSVQELQERILSLLGNAHARVLQPAIDAYPQDLARDELAAAAGYTNVNSKGFANAIGRLRSLGLIDYPSSGRVVATSVLFLGA